MSLPGSRRPPPVIALVLIVVFPLSSYAPEIGPGPLALGSAPVDQCLEIAQGLVPHPPPEYNPAGPEVVRSLVLAPALPGKNDPKVDEKPFIGSKPP